MIRFLRIHEIHGGARWVECNYGYGTFVHCDSERSLISSNAQDDIRLRDYGSSNQGWESRTETGVSSL
jgi:hypothetical protein